MLPKGTRWIMLDYVYAVPFVEKDKRVNIRISSRDLEGIQTIALEDGIPYQTLLHYP